MIKYDVKENKWLNVLARQYGEYTYIFCSCRDINSQYSMGDTYGKNNRAKGLEAKKKEITHKCIWSKNIYARGIDLFTFETVTNIECNSEDECRYLHRLINVIFKRFYVNDFGGPRIKNFPIDKIELTLKFILDNMRSKKMSEVELLGLFDKQFREGTQSGQIYIIDNKKTIKVGAAHNARQRFERLIENHELYPDAELVHVYEVDDEFGFEASAHCILNDHKDQNPYNTYGRDWKWGSLDEHFNCTSKYAEEMIEKFLNPYIINKM